MEADFQREYRINLVYELKNISWRRFLILLSGLSADSIWINIFANEEKIIEDPREAERVAENIWS